MDRSNRLYPSLSRRFLALIQEIHHLEARMAEERKALEAMVPVPVHWRKVKCGKDRCTRCPHGPYPYLRVKKDGKWRWKYLGKGWQPPEGFTRAGEFRERLARYRLIVERLVELRERLRELERGLEV
ncbi:hypothetical protein KZX47_05675 [Thermus sp. SYSU G05001]|uniref:DUF6788 domain-containing protein n=1 Tax=Thermus brevis TaxID=2862456 RepID=A0ABS6ZX53_9DEIN|nr:hypothetical protein [Thermus brevis]MBW6394642.1 hypothetical protein [Thermus brevis]